ncbi:unnamed protein product [Victoria cruziana]
MLSKQASTLLWLIDRKLRGWYSMQTMGSGKANQKLLKAIPFAAKHNNDARVKAEPSLVVAYSILSVRLDS